jgi:hypothetical protein
MSFVKYMPRYFIFPHYCKTDFFLYSFSIGSLLVYRNATDFCTLILYPATLMTLFMVSTSFLVEFHSSFRYRVMSSAKSDSLTSSLPICVPLNSSSYCIVIARISKTMLCRSRVGTLISYCF